MRIESNGAPRIHAPHHTPATTEGSSASPGKASSGPTDGVTLSGTAQELRAYQKAAADAPDVREDVVAELKAKIAAGQYNPPAEDIARKMLGS